MAQSNVEFTKKVKYQLGKSDYSDVVLDEYEKIEVAQHILNAQINGPDIIDGIEMPVLMLGADLDWAEGVIDDLIVGIAGNKRISITQDLDDENVQHIEYKDRFKFTLSVDEGGLNFVFPSNSAYVADFYIDWGDGTSSDITSWDDAELTHSYSVGNYEVEVKGICEYLYFSSIPNLSVLGECYNAETIKSVSFQNSNIVSIPSSWGKLNLLTSAESMFKYCSNLTSIPEDLFSSCPNILSFENTLSGCTSLEYITNGIFNYNTLATDFNRAFQNCSLTVDSTIPDDLFRYNIAAEDFEGVFFSSGISLIPVDLFRYNTAVTTFQQSFTFTLIAEIPIDLFRYNTLVTNFSYIFNNCFSLTTIPIDLFLYNPNVTKFNNTFNGCSGITEIPVKDDNVNLNGESLYGTDLFMSSENNDIPAKVNMFDYNPLVTTFSECFYGCSSLTSIPLGLFDYNTAVTSFNNTFIDCDSITAIPADLFRYNTLVNSFYSTFDGCSNITSISADLFKYNTLVTDFERVFESAGITDIPDDLFRYNIVAWNFSRSFQSCVITDIPADLFKYNVDALYFFQTFASCSNITTIPIDLFRYNVEALHFTSIFASSGITSIPVGMFDYNIKASAFGGVFSSTSIIEIPIDLFRYNTAVTRFDVAFYGTPIKSIPDDLFRYNTAVTNFYRVFGWCTDLYDAPDNLFQYNTLADNFSRSFEGCSNLSGSVTGAGELYDWMQSHSPTTFSNCFTNCTTIQDWDLIPASWGGGGLAALTNNMNFTIHGQDPTTWDFTLPINNALNADMDIEVDWGDGSSVTTITDYTSGDATHTYTNGEVDNTLNIKGFIRHLDFSSDASITSVGSLSRDLGLNVLKFQNCANLTDISNGGIEECRSLITASYMFYNTAITSIPSGIFDNGYYITNFGSTFTLTGVTSIPTDLFRYCPKALYFQSTFTGCSSVTSIPTDLFRYNPKAVTFYGVFNSTDITSIPDDLFRYNTLVTDFGSAFSSCNSLSTIPAVLFRYNVLVTKINLTFFHNTSLSTVPADLFRYNVLAEDFDRVFYECTSLTAISADLFLYNTAITEIGRGFKSNSLLTTAVTGVDNLIAQVETNNASVNKTGCFDGCTSITDYASIPIGATEWRTV